MSGRSLFRGIVAIDLDPAHVQLAGDDVVDQALAVFAEEADLVARAGDGGIDGCGAPFKVFGDGSLFGDGWNRNAHITDELPIRTRHLRAERRSVDNIHRRLRSKQNLKISR